ncbi:hypothetical protein BSK60_23815 [Paenibacillus odorifer]|nr:hypothetical protein BSK60_23815 [Paenibacillus odorifer]
MKFRIYMSNNTNVVYFIPVIRKSLEHELQFKAQLAATGMATFGLHWQIKKIPEHELQNYSAADHSRGKLLLVCLGDPEEVY